MIEQHITYQHHEGEEIMSSHQRIHRNIIYVSLKASYFWVWTAINKTILKYTYLLFYVINLSIFSGQVEILTMKVLLSSP